MILVTNMQNENSQVLWISESLCASVLQNGELKLKGTLLSSSKKRICDFNVVYIVNIHEGEIIASIFIYSTKLVRINIFI